MAFDPFAPQPDFVASSTRIPPPSPGCALLQKALSNNGDSVRRSPPVAPFDPFRAVHAAALGRVRRRVDENEGRPVAELARRQLDGRLLRRRNQRPA